MNRNEDGELLSRLKMTEQMTLMHRYKTEISKEDLKTKYKKSFDNFKNTLVSISNKYLMESITEYLYIVYDETGIEMVTSSVPELVQSKKAEINKCLAIGDMKCLEKITSELREQFIENYWYAYSLNMALESSRRIKRFAY